MFRKQTFINDENGNNPYEEIVKDVLEYLDYIEFVPFGLGGGMYKISSLPLSKSKGEHPYWLILKLNFIKEVFNEINLEEQKRK